MILTIDTIYESVQGRSTKLRLTRIKNKLVKVNFDPNEMELTENSAKDDNGSDNYSYSRSDTSVLEEEA